MPLSTTWTTKPVHWMTMISSALWSAHWARWDPIFHFCISTNKNCKCITALTIYSMNLCLWLWMLLYFICFSIFSSTHCLDKSVCTQLFHWLNCFLFSLFQTVLTQNHSCWRKGKKLAAVWLRFVILYSIILCFCT